MASIAEKFKKRNAKGNMSVEWSRTGTFLHKPERGWIHPDEQLASDAGICYGVRYIGGLEVKESMRSLDFDTRTTLAREAINRVSEAAGLKSASKRKKVDKRISRMLGDTPCMQYAGSNVNLTITIESINLMVMESGEVIADHLMPGISFASGGDAETLDFVAYVAKDEVMGRACHVLECGGGLSEDVITTIGQAFELRFKEYLKKQPKPVHRVEHTITEGDAWGTDNDSEYYNDSPGARPPSPKPKPKAHVPSEYAAPPSNLPVSDGVYSSVREPPEPVQGATMYDTAKETPLIDFGDGKNIYDNKSENNSGEDGVEEINPANRGVYDNHELPGQQGAANVDPFDMEPFNSSISNGHSESKSSGSTAVSKSISPIFEEWFHGNLSRKEAEKMLLNDGDFLVRQSSADTTQYVLSGRQSGAIKHLLLVDPEGVVRTKDHSFDSVPHLINFHRTKDIPIVSQESELHLKNPISNKLTMC